MMASKKELEEKITGLEKQLEKLDLKYVSLFYDISRLQNDLRRLWEASLTYTK
jgi:hypothetical protein